MFNPPEFSEHPIIDTEWGLEWELIRPSRVHVVSGPDSDGDLLIFEGGRSYYFPYDVLLRKAKRVVPPPPPTKKEKVCSAIRKALIRW